MYIFAGNATHSKRYFTEFIIIYSTRFPEMRISIIETLNSHSRLDIVVLNFSQNNSHTEKLIHNVKQITIYLQ